MYVDPKTSLTQTHDFIVAGISLQLVKECNEYTYLRKTYRVYLESPLRYNIDIAQVKGRTCARYVCA